MKRPTSHAILLLASLVFLLCSCGGDDDPKKQNTGAKSGATKTVGLSIAGKDWKGVFYATDKPGRSSLTATITQNGDAVVIRTSRASGEIGHYFTGTITSAGRMKITDAFDGEIWSTFFGPASANYIKLADFELPPSMRKGKNDFYLIELTRRGGSRPSSVENTAPGTDVPPATTPTDPPIPSTPELPPSATL